MSLRLNDPAPNFTAHSSQGDLNLYEFQDSHWLVFFSHPADFTPVCTTELAEFSRMQPEFTKRNCKLLGLSTNTLNDHSKWKQDIEKISKCDFMYPLVSDPDHTVAKMYGMMDTVETTFTIRSLFIIDPLHRIRLILTYPISTGRNVNEVLRCLDSLILVDQHKVTTPVNWRQGDKVIIHPSVSDEQANSLFPNYEMITPYLRFTNCPK